MSYTALSCFPKADCSNGFLVLNERKESIPLFGGALFVVGSTLLYPGLLAITVLSELYVAVDWSIHKYKHWSLRKKIAKIERYSDQDIQTLKNQRLQKLDIRKVKQYAAMVKTLRVYQNSGPLQESSLIEGIKKGYKDAVERAHSEDYSLSSIYTAKIWAEKVKVIRAYERTTDEIEIYNNETTDEVRKIFLKKYKFSKLRHQIKQHIDCHYLRNFLIMQIPIIGLIYLSQSKYTTKTSLEKTNLVNRYSSFIQENKWFKPY